MHDAGTCLLTHANACHDGLAAEHAPDIGHQSLHRVPDLKSQTTWCDNLLCLHKAADRSRSGSGRPKKITQNGCNLCVVAERPLPVRGLLTVSLCSVLLICAHTDADLHGRC